MLSWRERQILVQEDPMFLVIFGRSSSKHTSKSSRSSKSSGEERALVEKIKMAELMAEANYIEERQSLVFQTERLKVAKKMAKTKAQVQILEEPCDKILGRKEDVTGMRSLLQTSSTIKMIQVEAQLLLLRQSQI